jgi:conjugal transfer mating pair stabilization protein TraG
MQQAASKGDSADATKALNTVLSSDIGRRIEQAHRSDSNHTFSDSRSTALNYQQLLSRADTESTSTQDVLRAGSSLTAAVNQIGAPEYAQQYNTNAAFRRQQLDSGRRRDADPSTKTYRAQAESAMESGSTEAVLQDPGARDAVIRTRAATLQAADPNAPLEDRVGAIKYLTETAGVLTQLGVQGVTPAEVQRHDMNLPDPVDKTGIAGRVSAVPAASEKGPSPSHGLPRSALAIPQVEAATLGVSQGQMKDVQSESDIHAKVEDMHADADESGLGNEGHGTVVRVAANAADNAIDAIRPAGSRSRVKMGNRVPPVAPAQPETASESASETANPILDPRAQGAAMP